MKIVRVQSSQDGIELAKENLYKNCDKNTTLFLSGGSTPAPLYKAFAVEHKLKVGAVAMVDDRYGPSMHTNSNERMISESGFIKYLKKQKIPFYGILHGKSIEEETKRYEKTVHDLFYSFTKRVAILGIGMDGHIASISPRSNDLNHDIKFVVSIDDFPAEIRERITLTLSAISKMDLILVLAFGKEKKEGIKIALKNFFKASIAEKTILITNNLIIQSLN